MNVNLLNVLKQVTAQYGDSVLSEPKRVSAFFADLAQDEPKPQKNALVKCLEHKFVQTLKNIPENERANCKQKLAQKLHDEEGLDLVLCGETLELLALVLFGEEKKKIFCKNCGKELQEGWQACPFCLTKVESQEVGSAISSGSGSVGYGIPLIEQVAPVSSSGSGSVGYGTPLIEPAASTGSTNTVDKTAGCNGCPESKKNNCYYYGCDISEAAGYDCGMKMNDPDAEKLRKKKKRSNIIEWVLYLSLGLSLGSVTWGVALLIILGIALIAEIVKRNNRKKRRKNAQHISS